MPSPDTPNLDRFAAQGTRFANAASGMLVRSPVAFRRRNGRLCWS